MSSSVPFSLSIIIPAYNEAGRLPRNLARVAACCEALALPSGAGGEAGWEVLVMVEKSPDDTFEAVRAAAAGHPQIQVIDNEVQRGKGYAVRQGMRRARGEIALFMDADLSTPLSEVSKFLDYFAAHPEVDVLIGNRRHPSSHIGQSQGLLRRTLSLIFSKLVRGRIGLGKWSDTQCGFKAFRRVAASEIFSRQRLDGFSFDVEILVLAEKLGLRVVDLPVEWFDVKATTLRILRDGWMMLRDISRVRTLVARTLREQPLHPSSFSSPGD